MEHIFNKIRFKKFKSLNDSGFIPLKPLTLLVGANSSGKTAFLQPFLLLKQTLESRNIETPLSLRGKYVDLNAYKDIVYKHELDNNIELAFNMNFTHLKSNKYKLKDINIDDLFIHFKFGYNVKKDLILNKDFEIYNLNNFKINIFEGKITLTYQDSNIKYTFNKEKNWEHRNFILLPPLIPEISEFLDRIYIFNERISMLNSDLKEYRNIEQKQLVETKIRKVKQMQLYQIELNNRIKALEEMKTEYEKRINTLLQGISLKDAEMLNSSMNLIRNILNSYQKILINQIYYIGPLREYPRRYYFTSGEYPIDVGLEGENTIEIIYYDFLKKKKKYDKLRYWMKKMDLAYDIKLDPIAEGIYALVITDPKLKIKVNIADIGFGASQILPILVEGYYAQKGSLLLIEQPEIHLHPKLQADLCDLFIDIINEGKQLLVETHSEHIILRLQRKIAEGLISKDDVSILYFEPTEEGTKITNIEFDDKGSLKTWPEGFFEEDIEETALYLKALGSKKNVSSN